MMNVVLARCAWLWIAVVPAAATGITIADMNGDGHLDLVVITGEFNNANVSVVLGDGLGGFGSPTTFTVAGAAKIATADLNKDGKLDVVAGPGFGTNIWVLLGQPEPDVVGAWRI